MEYEQTSLAQETSAPIGGQPVDSAEGEKTRLRIRFTKCGDLRWISHRDLARLWERLLRRAGLRLAFSQGFHPKPRINFPSALALGIEALDEVVELEILGAFDLSVIERDIVAQMPAGMQLLEIRSPQYALGKARVLGATYRSAHGQSGEALRSLQNRIEEIRTGASFSVQRADKKHSGTKTITCNTQDAHFDVSLEDGQLMFSLPNPAGGSIRPSEFLDLLGLGSLLADGVPLQRTLVHLHEPNQVPTQL